MKSCIPCLTFLALFSGCSKPAPPTGPPPIEVAVRDSVVGRGRVIRLTNTGDRELQLVKLDVAGSDKKFSGVIAKSIPPHETKEVGWLELGFKVVDGMTIEVGCKDYPEVVSHTVK